MSAEDSNLTYYKFTNEILGALAVATAIGCVGTENPQFFGLVSLFYLILVWSNGAREYYNKNNRGLFWNIKLIFVKCHLAILGLTFLALVGFKLIDKHGLTFISVG